ncbi:MAG TPA: Crp/Fnr family transcriptional regulator [Candidatus Limnocylindrales bacterium]|jgi:CRP/FNR family cyclic AMP-dependent transcriptional regulator|nr:Crp/Fnr family transcriptional regulator [Candidatus Limnocylindrales bacterium]
MQSPYGMELIENCLSCNLCSEGFFCRLPKPEMEAFQKIKFTLAYPAGATLFVEGQACRGIYILCRGRVKLSATSSQGQTLIFKIAKPGEVLGLNATVSGSPHDTTAETGQACQLNFVKQADFLRFLTENRGASMHAAMHLSRECQQAYQQLRSFVMRSAPERIARLMLEWSLAGAGMSTSHGIKVALTHDEIGQIIGMSRETVTRTLADFRKHHIAVLHGSTLLIENMSALEHLAC